MGVTMASERSILMRLVHGELSPEEARRLEQRLDREPELRARYERLRASWEALELPPPPPAPAGFRDRVVAAARHSRGREVSWAGAPLWARAGAAAALAAGLLLGVGVGRLGSDGRARIAAASELEAALSGELAAGPPSLAEAYWQELEASGETLFADDEEAP